jgi:hypothetical protein
MRKRNYPYSFPIVSGNIVPATSSNFMTIANTRILGSPFTSAEIIGSGIRVVELTRPSDQFNVATYYYSVGGATSGQKLYEGNLVIHDYISDQLVLPNTTVFGLDKAFGKCYDFFIDGLDMFMISRSEMLTSNNTVVSADIVCAFKISQTDITNINALDEIYFEPTVSKDSIPDYLEISGGIRNYVGHYYKSDGNIMFVLFDKSASTLQQEVFHFIEYDRDTNKFLKSDKQTLIFSRASSMRPQLEEEGKYCFISEIDNLVSILWRATSTKFIVYDLDKNKLFDKDGHTNFNMYELTDVS